MAKAKKTRSKRAVPDYPGMVPAGCIIQIPVDGALVAFGRVLHVERSGKVVIEVFRKAGPVEDFDESVLRSGFAMPPFVQSVGAILDGQWPIVQRAERFELGPPERDFVFAYGMWPIWHKCDVRLETIQESIEPEEAARLLPSSRFGVKDREKQVAQAIREGREWKPGEPDPEWAARVYKSLAES